MTVKSELKHCLLNFPRIFPNALSVYDHWFCVIGNGYEWKDGELSVPYKHDKKYSAKTAEQAVINLLQYAIIEDWTDEKSTILSIIKAFMEEGPDNIKFIQNFVLSQNMQTMDYVEMIFNTKNRMNDFSIPVDTVLSKRKDYKFTFYPLCKYSRICNIPDDIKDDWLKAAKQMIDIMEEHKDLVKDEDNLFDKIKERVNNLYNERFK